MDPGEIVDDVPRVPLDQHIPGFVIHGVLLDGQGRRCGRVAEVEDLEAAVIERSDTSQPARNGYAVGIAGCRDDGRLFRRGRVADVQDRQAGGPVRDQNMISGHGRLAGRSLRVEGADLLRFGRVPDVDDNEARVPVGDIGDVFPEGDPLGDAGRVEGADHPRRAWVSDVKHLKARFPSAIKARPSRTATALATPGGRFHP